MSLTKGTVYLMIPYFISHTTFHFLYTMHPPQHSHADPPPADPDLLRFSSTQPDLTGICACRVAGIEKEGRNYEPGTGAGKWDGSRFPVPILSHSSALFFSPAAPQVRSHARSSVFTSTPSESRSAHTDYLRSFSAKYPRV